MAFDYSLEKETLVLPEKSFYPADIKIEHWQLRNLISSPEPNIIYYVANQYIYRLDTLTRTTKLIAGLHFQVRCSASGYGWMCAGGGSHGQLAVINLDPAVLGAAEVDAQLPIEFGARGHRRLEPLAMSNTRLERIGGDIVNSVSIHKLEGDESAGILDDVVAVLTNNDTSVRIYSLTQQLETAVMDLDYCANHATISPNGHTLIAVGDYQQAHFYERLPLESSKSKSSRARYASSQCTWELVNIVTLHVPKPPPTVCGYFSTAWSHCGSLCAVASESGYITIFDAERVMSEEGDDAVVAVIPSSRPDADPGPGAIRSMQFSPQPWDLLVWAEDQGRVCVADLRSALRVKQVLRLDPNDKSVSKVPIESEWREPRLPRNTNAQAAEMLSDLRTNLSRLEADFEGLEASSSRRILQLRQMRGDENASEALVTSLELEADHARRLRQIRESEHPLAGLANLDEDISRRLRQQLRENRNPATGTLDDASALGAAASYLQSSVIALSRRLQPPPANANDAEVEGLNAPERAVMDTIGRPTNNSSDPSPAPRSIRYEPSGQDSRPWRGGEDHFVDRVSRYTNGPSNGVENGRGEGTRRTPLQGNTRDHTERLYPYGPPRRQGSMVVAADGAEASRGSSSGGRFPRHPVPPLPIASGTSMRTSPGAFQRYESTPEITWDGPVPTEDRARERTAAPAPSNESPSVEEIRQMERLMLARERALLLRESRRLNDTEDRLLRNAMNRYNSGEPEAGVRTAGLVISPDGKTLWAGCETGIFEFTINLMERRTFPAIEMR